MSVVCLHWGVGEEELGVGWSRREERTEGVLTSFLGAMADGGRKRGVTWISFRGGSFSVRRLVCGEWIQCDTSGS